MPLIATRGAASAQGFGEFAQTTAPVYIEDVFSTYLYTSTGGDVTVTNGIDLSGKGGLVWIKSRSNAFDHNLTDTARGAGRVLYSNLVNGQSGVGGGGASSFSSTGYVDGNQNANGVTQVSWTFRKQAKFFDVVTYTGNGTTGQVINHNLGSVPGCIIVKNYGAAGYDWKVWHRLGNSSGTAAGVGNLNTTSTFSNAATDWFPSVTSTTFTVSSTGNGVNNNGNTFVAYVFAHDAGGFGASGTDNVISCGSFTSSTSANVNINLGYEVQFLLIKLSSSAGGWYLFDNMRGMPVSTTAGSLATLLANTSGAEDTTTYSGVNPTSTGFTVTSTFSSSQLGNGQTCIYIAIRRGPMKTPTSGTSVFKPQVVTDATTGNLINYNDSNFVVDSLMMRNTTYVDVTSSRWANRLTSGSSQSSQQGKYLSTPSTNAELNCYAVFDSNVKAGLQTGVGLYSSVLYAMRRAPGFFDVVCYTGTAAAQTQSHNLGIAPELMIVKRRSAAASWAVYSSALGNTKSLELNSTGAVINSVDLWNSTTPTSSVFSIGGSDTSVNASGSTYVNYLFATVAGVSKVGSYTGTGTTQTINCGFTAGSRFVMIKRTDSTGDWYVWDSARGIVAGNDPYLLLNSTAAEVTNTDYIDTANSGFEISSTAPAAINANGGTFIFLAIA
jgi:hypothetical protein